MVYGELVELVHLCLMLLASGLQLFLLLLKLPLSVLDRLPLGIRGSQLSFVPINKALTKQHLVINNSILSSVHRAIFLRIIDDDRLLKNLMPKRMFKYLMYLHKLRSYMSRLGDKDSLWHRWRVRGIE